MKSAQPQKIIYKTDTIVFLLNNQDIVNAIKELGEKETSTLQALQKEKEKADQDERLIKWVTNDGAFSVFTTLAVFILGFVIDRIYKWLGKRNDDAELKRYFKSQVEKVRDNVGLPLQDAYELLYKNTTIDKGFNSTPPKVLSGELKRINEVNANKLYQIYKSHDALSIILSQIDSIEKIQTEVEAFHTIIRNDSNLLRSEMQELSDQYTTAMANCLQNIKSINSNYLNDPNYIFLNDMLLEFHNKISGNRALKSYYEEIMRPLQERIVYQKLYLNQEWKLIADLGKQLSHKYNQLSGIIEEFKGQYETFYGVLTHANYQINQNINKL